MPRTKTQKPSTKRNRNSDEDELKMQLKEMQRIHDDYESERTMVWQRRKEIVSDILQKFRFSLSNDELEMTVGEFLSGKSTKNGSQVTEASRADDDGNVCAQYYKRFNLVALSLTSNILHLACTFLLFYGCGLHK